MKHTQLNENELIYEFSNLDQKKYNLLIEESTELGNDIIKTRCDDVDKNRNVFNIIKSVAKTGKLSYKQFRVIRYFIDTNTKYRQFQPYDEVYTQLR